MRRTTKIKHVFFLIFIGFAFFVWCNGQEEDTSSLISPMEKEEQENLYLAIQDFVGNWWNGSDLYPDPCGWTSIEGVSCDFYDGLWYISTLNFGLIYENSLQCAQHTKFRWQHLFELKYLTTLSFTNCFISPTENPVQILTARWEKLSSSLKSLTFRSNPGLVGHIPSTIGSLTELESLILLENGLRGKLPITIGDLVNLKRLVLAGNQFFGQIPTSFGGLTNLLIFDASRNSLSGSMSPSISGWTSLLKLDLSNNNLQGNVPKEAGNLKKLTLLDLGHNNFSKGLVQALEEMSSIEVMVLSNNPFMGGDLMRIQWRKLEKLETLDLSNMGMTGNIPKSMTELKRLRFLGLNNNKLSGTISAKLAYSLPNITALYIHGNNFHGKLEFPFWFYGKMGRRFGAWDNPNLCFSFNGNVNVVPFGVLPCQHGSDENSTISDVRKLDGNFNHSFHFEASFGYGDVGIMWAILGNLIVIGVYWNIFF